MLISLEKKSEQICQAMLMCLVLVTAGEMNSNKLYFNKRSNEKKSLA
jgi:hypothetical protein